MKKYSFILLLSVFFLANNGCTKNTETFENNDIKLEAKTLKDVEYGADVKQTYDIYLPKNRTKDTKVLILIHGGGWSTGSKIDMVEFKNFIREQLPEIAVVNMNYRLADANNPPFPMQINDISSVVNDLRTKAKEYQISTEIGFIGASAGAHLSLLWSYSYDTNKQVKMVCSIVGPTNLLDPAFATINDQKLQATLALFGNDSNVLEKVSPLYQVSSSSPATILFYGAQDPLIPNSQGITLRNRLKELNVKYEYTLYPNGAHGWLGLDLLDTSIKLKYFIQKNLL